MGVGGDKVRNAEIARRLAEAASGGQVRSRDDGVSISSPKQVSVGPGALDGSSRYNRDIANQIYGGGRGAALRESITPS